MPLPTFPSLIINFARLELSSLIYLNNALTPERLSLARGGRGWWRPPDQICKHSQFRLRTPPKPQRRGRMGANWLLDCQEFRFEVLTPTSQLRVPELELSPTQPGWRGQRVGTVLETRALGTDGNTWREGPTHLSPHCTFSALSCGGQDKTNTSSQP